MNWKVRLRNPVFWTTLLAALAGFVYTVLGLLEVAPALSQDAVLRVVSVAVSVLTTLGVLVDPTTKGVRDSRRARGYATPADSDKTFEEE